MNKIAVLIATIIAFGLILLGAYTVPAGWVLLAALAFMAAFIIMRKSELALGVVLAMFLFGLILPLKHNIYYVSHHIAITGHTVKDLDTNETYRIKSELFEKFRLLQKGDRYIACQHATLFGKMLADHFCYLIAGDTIYELAPPKR